MRINKILLLGLLMITMTVYGKVNDILKNIDIQSMLLPAETAFENNILFDKNKYTIKNGYTIIPNSEWLSLKHESRILIS